MLDKSIQLITDRLLLRLPQLSDADAIYQLAKSPQVALTTLTMPHPYEPEMAIEFINNIHEAYDGKTRFTFAITRRSDALFLGVIGFRADYQNERTEIGYWIGQPYWGNGIATEAAQAIVDFCFQELNLNRVEASYFEGNTGSKRVMEKIGMIYEGTSRQALIRDIPALNHRKIHDVNHYAILRHDWQAKRA